MQVNAAIEVCIPDAAHSVRRVSGEMQVKFIICCNYLRTLWHVSVR